MYDTLPEMDVKCPHCGADTSITPQTKSFDRVLRFYSPDDIFPYAGYGTDGCDKCKKSFDIMMVLTQDGRIDRYEPVKSDVCPFLYHKTDSEFYNSRNWGPFACFCHDGKIDALDVSNHVCACENHETNGQHCRCGNHPCTRQASAC